MARIGGKPDKRTRQAQGAAQRLKVETKDRPLLSAWASAFISLSTVALMSPGLEAQPIDIRSMFLVEPKSSSNRLNRPDVCTTTLPDLEPIAIDATVKATALRLRIGFG